MKTKGMLRIAATSAVLMLFAAAAWAHDVMYQGTVLAVESARIHVKTIDEKTKKEEDIWFAVDKQTKVKRGDKPVTYADAKVEPGERIVVVVNHDAKVKNVATDIRLATK